MNTTQEEPEIFLFTTEFPFGKGEQFLESEILMLSAFTNKLTVVPSRIGGKQRALPKNIKMDLTFAQSFPSTKKKIIEINKPRIYNLILQYENFKNILNPLKLARSVRAAYNAEKAREWAKNKFKDPNEKIVFYSYWLEFYTFGLALFTKGRNKTKLVSRAHGYDLYNYRHPFNFIPFREKLLESITKVYPVSLNGFEYLSKNYPQLESKFMVANLGTFDCGHKINFDPIENHLNIVSCSLLYPLKRIDLIAKSLFQLAKENPIINFNWTHIGDGPLMGKIAALVSSINRKNLTINLLGHLSNEEVLAFYKEQVTNVFINVSTTEGIPVSIMEAQSFGIPVVATAVGGIPEIVNNTNGILLSANPNIDEVKEAIKRFTDTEFQQQKRIMSRKNWETKYNAEKNYTRFYKEISHLH